MNSFFRSISLVLMIASIVYGIFQVTRYFFPNFDTMTSVSSRDKYVDDQSSSAKTVSKSSKTSKSSGKKSIAKKPVLTEADKRVKKDALANLINDGFFFIFVLGVFLVFRREP